MSSRSLNKVQLIGNLTRDPELRYTPQGTAVCTFGLATNRSWMTDSGDRREDTEFHRIVAWNKLAELCSQLLFKGRKVYVEGRLQTRNWTSQDGSQRQTTEVVIGEMIILDSRQAEGGSSEPAETPPTEEPEEPKEAEAKEEKPKTKSSEKSTKKSNKKEPEEENPEDISDDIPF
ncbi:MAG TPA: single-stranded DNA-binding protein [Clostridia bacterium]|nr:single-stranded DNA-binding protein [Clostridia bacterium]